MIQHTLTGLDGSNPLGFLAALGVLRVLHARGHEPRLAWSLRGTWTPLLDVAIDREALVNSLDEDRARWAGELALQLSYDKGGGDGAIRDLKPRPEDLRRWLARLLKEGSAESLALSAVFFAETAVDNNGNIKPTALHFTAGQQQFLAMANDLQARVEPDDLVEAMWGPWTYQRELPVLGWDNSASRDYALRASDPSKEKKAGVPGADWLALRGLAFLPVMPRGARVLTPGASGGWKTGAWTWPLWTVALQADTVGSLMTLPDLSGLSSSARAARGIGAVFTSGIRRTDQGGYGSFKPSKPT